jgi:hypothetical protein
LWSAQHSYPVTLLSSSGAFRHGSMAEIKSITKHNKVQRHLLELLLFYLFELLLLYLFELLLLYLFELLLLLQAEDMLL